MAEHWETLLASIGVEPTAEWRLGNNVGQQVLAVPGLRPGSNFPHGHRRLTLMRKLK